MKNEPVVTAAAISGAVVAAASIFGVVLDLSAVQTIVVIALPLVLSLFARQKVTPVA